MQDRCEVGDELAVWDRAAIQVTWKAGAPFQTDVTIESPTEQEKVLCRVGRGPFSDTLLRMMSDPGATA